MSIEFLLTSLIVVIVPGTGVIYTVSVAMSSGRRPGLLASLACTLGIVPHLVAAVFGLSAFLHAGALAFRVLKYAGVAYLLFLAYSMLRSEGAAMSNDGDANTPARKVLTRGILLNLLNPKLTIFFFAFLPQFLSADASAASLLGLGAVFMLMTLVVFAGYALTAARLRQAFGADNRIRRRVERSMGLLLAAFAARLALSDR